MCVDVQPHIRRWIENIVALECCVLFSMLAGMIDNLSSLRLDYVCVTFGAPASICYPKNKLKKEVVAP